MEIVGRDIRYSEIIDAIVRGYSKVLGSVSYYDVPSKIELEIARALYDLKYTRKEWNYGYNKKIRTWQI
jgi:lipoate-protein ligase A